MDLKCSPISLYLRVNEWVNTDRVKGWKKERDFWGTVGWCKGWKLAGISDE